MISNEADFNSNLGVVVNIARIGENILKNKLVIRHICNDIGIMSRNDNHTYLFVSKHNESNEILAGFDISSFVEKEVLEHNNNYQQLIGRNKICTSYTSLYVGTTSAPFFEKILSKRNTEITNMLCQTIVYQICKILSKCSCDKKKNKEFELKVLECMQSCRDNSFDSIYI